MMDVTNKLQSVTLQVRRHDVAIVTNHNRGYKRCMGNQERDRKNVN